jgi:hypothetical protein
MDGIASLLLLVLYLLFVFVGKKRMTVEIPVILSIALFYLFYSFYLSYNSQSAVVMDFMMQVRPYLAFFMISQMAPSFSDSQKQLLKRICLYIWPFFIPIGIYGLMNPSFFKTVMDQEANYVSGMVCLSLVYLYCSRFTVKELFTFIFMLTTGMIAIHAKFYGFYFLAIGILICFQHVHSLKNGWRTGIAVGIAVALIFYMSKSQIAYYLMPPGTGNAESGLAAQAVLYRSAVDILRDFVPFGSGFASFATPVSGEYYSQIYAAYGLNSIDGFSPRDWHSVSGAYYPSLVQFGIVGIVLYLFFWVYIASKALLRFRQEGDRQSFVMALIMIGFVFIENLSDSFFTSNKGFFMMIFLGLLAGKYKKSMATEVAVATFVVEAAVPVESEAVAPSEAPAVPLHGIPPVPPEKRDWPAEYAEPVCNPEAAVPEVTVQEEEEIEPEIFIEEPEEEAIDAYEEDEKEEHEDEEKAEDEKEDTAMIHPEELEDILFEAPCVPLAEEEVVPEETGRGEEAGHEVAGLEIKEAPVAESTFEPEETVPDIPLMDEDFRDVFLTFEPLPDGADNERTDEWPGYKNSLADSIPEKQNEDRFREKTAAMDEETDEETDEDRIEYAI